MTPIHGRKSTFYYTPGTTVDFDCDPDFVLVGERRRTCQANGEWSVPTKGSQDGRTETEWANWNPAKTTRCIGKFSIIYCCTSLLPLQKSCTSFSYRFIPF